MDKAKGTKEELAALHQAADDKKWETFNKSGQQALTHTPGVQVNGNAVILGKGEFVQETGVESEVRFNTNDIKIIISFCIAPFARGYKALLPIITVSGKLSVILLHLRVQLAKCIPYQHLD